MEEIHKLRAQISSIVQTNFPTLSADFVPGLRPPGDLQVNLWLIVHKYYLHHAPA
jgi:ATP-dependent RNA helicase DHX37/DHR1